MIHARPLVPADRRAPSESSTGRGACCKLRREVARDSVKSLFEPHPALTDPEVRRRSQLLSVCLVVLGLIFACVDTVLSVSIADYRVPWFGYAALLGAFTLNRAGYYRIAAPIVVMMFPIVVFVLIYSGHGYPDVSFGYLVIAPMVAAIFLPVWGVGALTALNLIGIAITPLIEPFMISGLPQLIGLLSVNAMVGLLAWLYMHHRNALERDRRRALEDGEERLRLSLDAAKMGTWQLDCEREQLSLDARASELIGPLNTPAALLAAFESEGAGALSDALAATIAGKQPGFELVGRLRSQGIARHVELTGRAVSDRSGRALCVNGTLVDVSARRNLEEQLQRSQKMEALGRMSGGIAHDFNNVLTVILVSVALLRRRTSAPELDEVDAAARSAAALTGKLLAFSRGAVIAPRVLDLNAVVRDAVAMVTRLIGEDIVIRHHPSDGCWPIRIDGNQLEQVLLNLAANARDAMPDGGTLTIEVENVTLGPHDLPEHPDAVAGAYVRLRVSDTGRGMDADIQRHIFEPFFTTKERGKGTGLGLATVFGTVSQSGGFIETQSTPGQGSRFDLYFPKAHGSVSAAQRTSVQTKRGSETLLLVEDDVSVRKLLGMILEGAGYRVLSAPTVPEARATFAEHQHEIALLITDEVMPGGRGSDLVVELRRIRPELRALCITGYIEPRATSTGEPVQLATLQKPFEDELLLRRVRELLDERAPSDVNAQVNSG
jgi:signal transduction histidine kinase